MFLGNQPTESGLVCGCKRRFKVLWRSSLFDFTGRTVHLDDSIVLVLPAHCNRAHPDMLVAAVLIRQDGAMGREPVGKPLQKTTALAERERHGWLRLQTLPARPAPLRGRPLQPTAVTREVSE